MIKKRLCLFLLLCVFILQYLIGCGIQRTSDEQARNLQKLGRVWGFAMFTHRSFLEGQKDWDEELLKLIPVVKSANENEVNDILYDWFIGLGDDGYDLDWETYRVDLIEYYEDAKEFNHNFLIDSDSIIDSFTENIIQSQLQAIDEAINFISGYGGVFDWTAMEVFAEELFLLNNSEGTEMNWRPMADTNWINESYLGSSLHTVLSQFHQIQIVDLANAPVYFNMLVGTGTFTNMNDYPDIDYSDERYRLLGLFRLWNVIEYYFPYMDILNDSWHELLLEFIPKMLEESDKLSYEMTLAEISSKLHDAHISLSSTWGLLNDKFGSFSVPVALAEVEGKFVVAETSTYYRGLLERGDIILTLNGIDINEIATDMLKYLSYPNDDKALRYIVRLYDILKSHTSEMEIRILRDSEELTLSVKGYEQSFAYNLRVHQSSVSHELLDNNIGLINPEMLKQGDIEEIMKNFADTDGLIIDLRQYPSWVITYELAEYLVQGSMPFCVMSSPLKSIPGMFIDIFRGYSGGITNPDAYFYDKNVVILMNEWTQSQAEFTIMSLRNSSNVTVIGTNSIGADGNVTNLPLPGGIDITFTGLGVYTPEGGQTQRIGLSPDIYVDKTILGIKEGRDELMEAAVIFLLEQ